MADLLCTLLLDDADEIRSHPGTHSHPGFLSFGGLFLFLSYSKALALARELRIAAGAEERDAPSVCVPTEPQ